MEEMRMAQKNEAIERMKILKLHPNAVREFVDEGKLNCSENGMGALFWLSDEDAKYVRAMEEKTDCLVYHVVKSVTQFGTLLTMLYVSKDEEEWERDKEELKSEGYACAYVENLDDEYCSEFGGVIVQPIFGGVRRIA